ncbi:Acidic endochitinase [Podochytrium sp. JEL0797]|nr:Acidic endochitinase [Podochytrium sp. JEL0797]
MEDPKHHSNGNVAVENTTSRSAKRKLCIIVLAAIVFIVAAALIGYFMMKPNNSSQSAATSSSAPAASNGTASVAPVPPVSGSSPTPSTSTSPPTTGGKKHKLLGYFGANAIANGVDLIKGTSSRITDPSGYQLGLASYCDTGYYDTINLAFLNIFGGGQNHFQITFGAFNDPNLHDGTYIYSGGSTETNDATTVGTFLQLGIQIQHCQSKNVKIVISLGGDRISAYTFVAGDGAAYANLFYNMFLEGSSPVRPFGPGVILDGIELDIEKNDNPAVWTPEMITMVQTLRSLSPKTQLALVPQCYLNKAANQDLNVGDVITATAPILDYIVIQYYNNPTCSYPFDFNYNAWKGIFNGSMVVGLAGDWTSAISGGFLEPGPLQAVYDMIGTDSQFLGFSVYDVSSSNPPAFSWTLAQYSNPPNSTYSKTLRDVLNGVKVGSGFAAQGAPILDSNLSQRCGGTWVYANATCSNTLYSSEDENSPAQQSAVSQQPAQGRTRAAKPTQYDDTILIKPAPAKPAVSIATRGSSRIQPSRGPASSTSNPTISRPAARPLPTARSTRKESFDASYSDTVLIPSALLQQQQRKNSADPSIYSGFESAGVSVAPGFPRIPEDSQSTAYEPSGGGGGGVGGSASGGARRLRKTSPAGISTGESSTTASDVDPTQLLPSALADSKLFRILPPDKLEDHRKELSALKQQVSALKNRLTLESKIREAAMVLAQAEGGTRAEGQLEASNKKVDAIARDLRSASTKLMDVERVILKHTAGVLRFGARNYGSGAKGISRDDADETAIKMASSETKLKEYEREIVFLKSTVTRLENDSNPLKKEVAALKTKLDSESQDKRKLERSLRDATREIKTLTDNETYLKSTATNAPASSDVNRLKLDLATLRSENSNLQEELSSSKTKLSDLQSRLDQELNLLEDKDRTITNLLSELEEVTNQLEITASINEACSLAAGDSSTADSSQERRLRKQVELLEAKFKELSTRDVKSPVFSRAESIVTREKNAEQTESARSVMRAQLQVAVEEKERVEQQLAKERRKVGELKVELDEAEQRLSKQKGGISDTHVSGLKTLWTQLPSLTSFKTPSAREARDAADSFSFDDFIKKVGLVDSQRRDLKRSLETAELDLETAKTDFKKLSRSIKTLESSESQLKEDVRELDQRNEQFSEEVRELQLRNEQLIEDLGASQREFSLMNAASSGSSKQQIEDLQASHATELASQRERYEKKIKDVQMKFKDELQNRLRDSESNLSSSSDKKVKELERQLKAERELGDEAANRLAELESSFQRDRVKMESRHEQELTELETTHASELAEALDRERSRNEQVRAGLEEEVQELQRMLDDASVAMETNVRDAVQQAEEALQTKFAAQTASAESSFRDEIAELQQTHARALEEEVGAIRESETVRRKEELRQLEEDYAAEMEEMKRNQERAENALLSTKSKFFADREELQEEIDQLEEQLRSLKQPGTQTNSGASAKTLDLESAIENLQADLADVERDYLTVSGQLVTQKMQFERDLQSERDSSMKLQKRLDSVQKKLTALQEEHDADARSASPPVDSAEVQKLQQTIVDLKRAKNELLEELDDRGFREANLQAELNRFKKENERTARNLGDWKDERSRFETMETQLRDTISTLQARIQEFSVTNLGSKASSDPPTTQALRSDFRKLVSDLRQEYQIQLTSEMQLRTKVEAKLRKMNQDRDDDLYSRNDLGTQTAVRWITGDQPSTRSFGF